MFSIITICCAAYIFGIVSAPIISFLYVLLFTVCVILAILLSKIVLKYKTAPVLLAAVMFLAGNARYLSAAENSLYNKFPEKYVEICGTVRSLPQISLAKYKYRYEVMADSLTYLGETYHIDKKILLNTTEELSFGDTVRAWGFLTDFSEVSNEFGFNYKLFYKSKGIFARLTAFELSKTGRANSLSPAFWAGKLRYRIFENMQSCLDDESFALTSAVLFGDKSYFDKNYRTLLLKTGVGRILYSSFTHISIIIFLVSLLSSKKKYRNILFIAAITFYILFVNSSSIALKACITAGLVICAKQLKGYSDKFSILSYTVFLLTVYNPLLCFDAGFMMSVISTALILLCYKPVYRRLSGFRKLRKLRLAAPLSVFIILLFGAMPFSAYYFNGTPIYSVFLVPVLLPFVAAVIFTAPILFINGGAYLFLSPIGLIYHGALSVLHFAPFVIKRLPFYYITLPTPSVIAIIFFCLLWWIFIRAISYKFNTSKTKLILAAALGLFICIALDFSINSLGIYFVNVGQGDAAVLHTSYGETVLIDGGGSSDYEKNYNIGESIFLPYLISHGFTHIDVAIVSHYHKDHAEGIVTAAENLKINTLILPDSMPDSIYRLKLEELARKKDIKTEYLHIGDEIRFRSGLKLYVIAPDVSLADDENENNTSLVIKASYGDFTALFTGDFEAEENLLPPRDIDLLKVSHHGSQDGNSSAFIRALNPRIAVISVGKDNRYGLPDNKVVAEFENMGATVLRTDLLGDIRFKIDKNGNIKYNSLLGGNQNAAKRR
ncbi:MAG: DNA internalization-related competence protein ComEC/Rec2 [Firmicutes bacterium]|nr:DNA internalization-related competence protein ComEC/Rec2 [Bacillota bacterium]